MPPGCKNFCSAQRTSLPQWPRRPSVPAGGTPGCARPRGHQLVSSLRPRDSVLCWLWKACFGSAAAPPAHQHPFAPAHPPRNHCTATVASHCFSAPIPVAKASRAVRRGHGWTAHGHNPDGQIWAFFPQDLHVTRQIRQLHPSLTPAPSSSSFLPAAPSSCRQLPSSHRQFLLPPDRSLPPAVHSSLAALLA